MVSDAGCAKVRPCGWNWIRFTVSDGATEERGEQVTCGLHDVTLLLSSSSPGGVARDAGAFSGSKRRTQGWRVSGVPWWTAVVACASNSAGSTGEYLRLATASYPARTTVPAGSMSPPPGPRSAATTRCASFTAPAWSVVGARTANSLGPNKPTTSETRAERATRLAAVRPAV